MAMLKEKEILNYYPNSLCSAGWNLRRKCISACKQELAKFTDIDNMCASKVIKQNSMYSVKGEDVECR